MPAQRIRNSLGQFQDSWYLDDGASGGRPSAIQFAPASPPSWKFRRYVKGPRRQYWEGDRGTFGGRRIRVYAKTPEELKIKAAEKERRIRAIIATVATLNGPQLFAAAESITIAERLGANPVEIVREYEKKKDARCQASPGEIAAKRELQALLHKNAEKLPVNKDGHRFYQLDDVQYVLEETLRRRSTDDGSGED